MPDETDIRLRGAAERGGISKAEWVRRAIEGTLQRNCESQGTDDPPALLASLGAPAADIDQMLAEIEAGCK